MVVSGHSPAPPGLKRTASGDFASAWAGIASLQLSLPVTWTTARQRGYSLEQVASWMCRAPALLAGFSRKGRIDVGYDADLVVFDPEAEFSVDPASLRHRHPVTPYLGRRLSGVVERTYLRGVPVYRRGETEAPQPRGQLLTRG
jgi:allantoinase